MANMRNTQAAVRQNGLQYNPNETTYADIGFANNPYQYIMENDPYGMFSGNNKWARWYEMSSANIDYLANIGLMKAQNEYNSPTAKAARLRQAGINPDIAGLEGADSSTDASVSALTGSHANQNTGFERTTQILGTIGNLLPQIMNIASYSQDIKGKQLDNLGKQVSLQNEVADLNDKLSFGMGTHYDFASQLGKYGFNRFVPAGLSARNTYQRTADFRDSQNRFYQSQWNYAQNRNNPLFSVEQDTFLPDSPAMKEFFGLMFDTIQLDERIRNSQSRFEHDNLRSFQDYELEANKFNRAQLRYGYEQMDWNRDQNKFNQLIRDNGQEWQKFIQKLVKSDKFIDKALAFLLQGNFNSALGSVGRVVSMALPGSGPARAARSLSPIR